MSSDKDNYVHWKVPVGAVLFVCLILLSPGLADGSWLFIFISFLFAVGYGLFSKDIMLSAIFGFLFFLSFPCAIILRYHDVPPPAALPYLLLWGLVTALIGVISGWVGRKMPFE